MACRLSPVLITSSTRATRLPWMARASLPSRHRVWVFWVVMEFTSSTSGCSM